MPRGGPRPKASEEPRFEISYDRTITGRGKNIQLADLVALVQAADDHGFPEDSRIIMYESSFYDGSRIQISHPRKVEVSNG
jgi:hypothetical protein